MARGPKGRRTYLVKRKITWWPTALLEGATSRKQEKHDGSCIYLSAPAEDGSGHVKTSLMVSCLPLLIRSVSLRYMSYIPTREPSRICWGTKGSYLLHPFSKAGWGDAAFYAQSGSTIPSPRTWCIMGRLVGTADTQIAISTPPHSLLIIPIVHHNPASHSTVPDLFLLPTICQGEMTERYSDSRVFSSETSSLLLWLNALSWFWKTIPVSFNILKHKWLLFLTLSHHRMNR